VRVEKPSSIRAAPISSSAKPKRAWTRLGFAIEQNAVVDRSAQDATELIQALGLSLLTSTAALAVALAREGALPISLLGASIFALAPAGIGVLFGQWLRKRTHPAVFVRVFAVGLLLIGLDLALRNLT
jgi:hypothetical protein